MDTLPKPKKAPKPKKPPVEQPAIGRPTLYSNKLIKKAWEYLEKLPSDEVVHSIEGLCLYVGIHRDTFYDWEGSAGKEEFSYIGQRVRALQTKQLINGGLKGILNSSISKVMLSKHGYREGIEHAGENGGAIKVDISSQLSKVYGDTGSLTDEVPTDS